MSFIQSILIRTERKANPVRIQEAQITLHGIEGDHYNKPDGRRQVTIVAAADLAEVAAIVGFQGDSHLACRRNICVDQLPEGDMIGRQLALGKDVVIEVTCYCDPCQRMNENFGEGAQDAFDRRAGWGARVIRDGHIRVGDTLKVL